MADDLGVDQLACYGLGSNPASTPTIDALAAGGVRFTRVWSNTLCTPTRATLLTGRYGFRTGVGHLADFQGGVATEEWTLPELLEFGEHGEVRSGFFGKWHTGYGEALGGTSAPNVAGYDHYVGVFSNLYPAHVLEPDPVDFFKWVKTEDGAQEYVLGEYATTATVDWALAWIAEQTGPWHAHVAFHAPHHPWHAPPSHLHTVDLSAAGEPDQDPVPYYRAMVEALDTELGRLLAGLGDALDDTVVVVLGDNGTPDHVILPPFDATHGKTSLYEGGIHVPLIVDGPGVASGAVCEALVNTTDLWVTALDLQGVDLHVPQLSGVTLDSVSIVPYLVDPSLPSQREYAYSELFQPNGFGPYTSYEQAIRGKRYKLIRRMGAPDQFFDLLEDPHEQQNLLLGELTGQQLRRYRKLKEAMNALKPLPAPAGG